VVRTTTWGSPFEEAGRFDWIGIAQQLHDLADADAIIDALRAVAKQLPGLRERLSARGVSKRLLDMPGLQFNYLHEKLAHWRLL
jgi:serine/threonine-protein kinase HipA